MLHFEGQRSIVSTVSTSEESTSMPVVFTEFNKELSSEFSNARSACLLFDNLGCVVALF